MRLNVLAVLVVVLTVTGRAQTNATVTAPQTVTCAAAHLTFALPDYWTVIPADKVTEYRQKLREMFPQRPVPNYVMAAQRKALFTFAMPYLLIELDDEPMPTIEAVQQEAAAFAANVRGAYVDLYRSNLFGEVKVMDAFYDDARHVIIGSWNMMRARDDRRIAAIDAIFPYRKGYVRFHFFLPAETQERDLPAVESVVDSVVFARDYAYRPVAAGQGRPLRYALYSIVVVLGVVWVAMRFVMRAHAKR
jgi:hypothetical protein